MSWPRGSGEMPVGGNAQDAGYPPVTVIQSPGSQVPEEPFFASGNVAYRQGFVGSGRAQPYVVASAG
jgi:hypothetical protein